MKGLLVLVVLGVCAGAVSACFGEMGGTDMAADAEAGYDNEFVEEEYEAGGEEGGEGEEGAEGEEPTDVEADSENYPEADSDASEKLKAEMTTTASATTAAASTEAPAEESGTTGPPGYQKNNQREKTEGGGKEKLANADRTKFELDPPKPERRKVVGSLVKETPSGPGRSKVRGFLPGETTTTPRPTPVPTPAAADLPAGLSPAEYDKLSPEQKDKILSGDVGDLVTQRMNAMTPADLEKLNWASSIKKGDITPDVLNKLKPDVLQSVPWEGVLKTMKPADVAALKPELFQSMNLDSFIGRIPPKTLDAFPDPVIEAISPKTLSYIPAKKLEALSPARMELIIEVMSSFAFGGRRRFLRR